MELEDYKRIAADSSGLNCPVRKTLELIQGKWTLYVIFELSKADVLRFGALKKKLPGMLWKAKQPACTVSWLNM